MPDIAQITRSISTLKTELTFLKDSGVLTPQQLESIEAQLPHNGKPSQYVDPKYGGGQWGPQAPVFTQIAQHAQDPHSPANPNNEKHHEWAKHMASKFGNAALWGAGATFGGNIVNDAMKQF